VAGLLVLPGAGAECSAIAPPGISRRDRRAQREQHDRGRQEPGDQGAPTTWSPSPTA